MAKHRPKTKVIINGIDVSSYVHFCNLPRHPSEVDTVDLSIDVSKLEVSEDGVLVIHIDTEE